MTKKQFGKIRCLKRVVLFNKKIEIKMTILKDANQLNSTFRESWKETHLTQDLRNIHISKKRTFKTNKYSTKWHKNQLRLKKIWFSVIKISVFQWMRIN